MKALDKMRYKARASRHPLSPPSFPNPLPRASRSPCNILEAIMPNVFSVPIFFVVFRETLEAAIIVSVLLSVAERIANTRLPRDSPPTSQPENGKENITSGVSEVPPSSSPTDTSSNDGECGRLLKKLRIQVCRREPLSSSNPRA